MSKFKLTVVEADTFYGCLGITKERSSELGTLLDETVKKAFKATGKASPLKILAVVIDKCETLEEVVFCAMKHTNWVERLPADRKGGRSL